MITPYLSFSKSALTENVRWLHEHSVAKNRHWAAALTDVVPADLIREAVLSITKLASCRTIAHAEFLSAAGFQKIMLTGRVIDVDSLQRLRALAERAEITAVIDHFRHAELLSQCVQSSENPGGAQIRVLIEVDLGQQSAGVCPGPDAARLASAVARLPGLSVVGVFASCSDGWDDVNFDENTADSSANVTITEHALRSIREVTSECCEIVVLVSSAEDAAWSDSRVTTLIASPFITISYEADDPVRSPCVLLTSMVVSRPTLEWCIIDVGRVVLADASEIYVHAPTGAAILRSTDDTSTLQLSGESIDLRIGDIVQLGSRFPERFLNIRL